MTAILTAASDIALMLDHAGQSAIFIEAALEATGDNRTSAAEVLGVSRQSLYVRLRRYNLGGAGVDSSAAAATRKAPKGKRKSPRKW